MIVPSLSLLGQTLRTWTGQANVPFSYLAACSDETITSSDSFTAWTSDLGVPVTTNSEAIRAFLVGRAERCVVFSTYHSSPAVAAAQDAGAPGFDLVIADEAHRAAGRVDAAFGTVLDAQRIRAARRLFMTATPRFVSGRVRAAARERDLEITSMDDVATFGPVLHQLPFRQAIERGLLSDYRVVVIGVNDPGIGRAVERRELVTTTGEFTMDAETLARQVGLLRAVDRFQLRRVLTFHSRKAAARSFAGVLPAVLGWLPSDERPPGRLWAQHITGDMSAGEREVILDRLRSLDDADWGLLSNVRCVAEGVDVPTLDGVVFIDPRRSQIDVVQAVGRAIRRSAEKKLGIVVIPVFVPPHADDEDLLDLSDFRIVWDVVRALRAHDDVLAEQLDDARFQIGRRAGLTELPGKIILDLPRGVTADFARALCARIVQATTSAFEFWFGLLVRYVEAHGTAASIEHRTEFDGYRLGRWVTNQRVLHGSGRLKAERAKRLESITGWVWRRRPAQQAFGFWVDVLRQYVDKHGTAETVDRNTVWAGYNLGEWAMATRTRYSRGVVSTGRVAQLEAVPGWVWSKNHANWDRMFELLQNHVDREGHAAVKRAHVEDGEPLGKWVANLRNTYKGLRPGILTAERIAGLEALPGWAWDRREAIFEQGYSALLAFTEREGHAVVPEGHVENGVLLQSWINRQRHDHTTGRIQRFGDNRVARLEAVPGWRWRRSPGERTGLAGSVHQTDARFRER